MNDDNKRNNNNYINKKEEKYRGMNLPEYYVDKCSLVLNYAYKEDSNSHYRDYMEDKERAIENLNYDENNAIFCLFDGHGGGEVSTYLQKNFAIHMKNFSLLLLMINYYFLLNFLGNDKKLKELNYFEICPTGFIIYIQKKKIINIYIVKILVIVGLFLLIQMNGKDYHMMIELLIKMNMIE